MKKIDFKDRKTIIVVVVIVAVLVLVIGGVTFMLLGNKEEPNKKSPDPKLEEKFDKPNEETLKDEYDITLNDAINLVKERFNSDSYEYDAEVMGDSRVKVTVTNSDTNSKYVFIVEPNRKTVEMVEE